MKKFSRAWACTTRVLVLVPVLFVTVLAGCSGPNPFQAAKAASSTTVVNANDGNGTPTQATDNGFIPDRNVSDCVGTNERPTCGSSKKGGLGMWLTFGALILGVGFVMWRISVSVRKRDGGVVKPQGNTF
jgi:hypothetical protein